MDTRWRLEVLGPVRLDIDGRAIVPERKAAAVLCYLAVEGPTPRTRLAGLLWPDSEEATARNNLTQTLRRLRLNTNAEPVRGDNPVRLSDDFEVDAAALERAALAGDAQRLLSLPARLLDGFDYDDCPEFELWRDSKHERIARWRADAQLTLVHQLEVEARYAEALVWVEQMIADDPLAETGYRSAMRLHYLAGDRGAALRTYLRCREVLDRELGVEPLPETVELAERIERGEIRPARIQAGKRAVPMHVLRPPRLIGREREWARMEEAWAAGKGIVLSGPPGSGKSRLMRDFLETNGRALHFSARAGDALVPYGTHARTYRELLDLLATEGVAVPAWVTMELARIVPGLGPAPGALDEAGKVRFYQAKVEALRLASRAGYRAMGFDDLHNTDLASVEAGSYALAQLRGAEGDVLQTIHAVRPDELDPDLAAFLAQAAGSDGVVQIELEPWTVNGVRELLGSLELGDIEDLVEPLERYTGGNPLFVLETLKHLIERDELERRVLPTGLPPGKVHALIHDRLRRLSIRAARAMQAAAVLGSDFDLEVLGAVLEVDALDLIEPWHELERSHVVRGNRFLHDVVQESVLSGLPAAVRALLHRRAAEVLAERGAAPARIAQHWQDAGSRERAAPYLLRAAERAHQAFRHREAAALYQRAADAYDAGGDRVSAFDATYRQSMILHGLSADDTLERTVDRLFELATDELQQALAWQARCDAYRIRGNARDLETAARTGLAVAAGLRDPGPQTELTFSLAAALWLQGRVEETLEPLRVALARIEGSPHRRLHAEVERWLGSSSSWLDRWQDADAHLLRARELALRVGDTAKLAVIHSELGLNALRASDAARASDELASAWKFLQPMEGVLDIKLASAAMQASAWRARGMYDRALAVLDEAEAIGRDSGFLDMGFVHLERARCALDLGDLAEAGQAWQRAEAWPGLAQTATASLNTVRLDLLRARGDMAAARALAGEMKDSLDAAEIPGRAGPLLLALAAVEPPEVALELTARAFALAASRGATGLEAAVRTRRAQALLALNRVAEAVQETDAAVAVLPPAGIAQMTYLEIWLTHHEAQSRIDPVRAEEALLACRRWLADPARGVATEHRLRFAVPAA